MTGRPEPGECERLASDVAGALQLELISSCNSVEPRGSSCGGSPLNAGYIAGGFGSLVSPCCAE